MLSLKRIFSRGTPANVVETQNHLEQVAPVAAPAEQHHVETSVSESVKHYPVLEITDLQTYAFPVLSHAGKVRNTDFIAVKRDVINQAFASVKEYSDYVGHLPPIGRNEGFCRHIEYITKGFIGIFWDMPSSKRHHDSEPFGHLVHSLEVACRQAYLMSKQQVVNEGGLDSEQTKKQRPYLVMTGFIAGLLHDSNKIFNYDLQSHMGKTKAVFSPTFGSASILDFCLKYPPATIKKDWKRIGPARIYYGINTFYNIVPMSLRVRLSGEMYEYIFSIINGVKDTSDQAATKYSLAKSGYMSKVQECVHELLLHEEALNHPQGWGFKISANWYIVRYDRFINSLSRVLGAQPESLAAVLMDNGVLFASPKDRSSSFQVGLLFVGEKRASKEIIGFIAAPFFDQILLNIRGAAGRSTVYGVKIPESYKDFFMGLEFSPALPKTLFLEKKKPDEATPDDPQQDAAPREETIAEQQEAFSNKNMQSVAGLAGNVPAPTAETPPLEVDPAVPAPKKSRGLDSIKDKISDVFFLQADKLAMSVLEAIANAFGCTQKSIANDAHLQKTATDGTIFYLIDSQQLWARYPHILHFGWELFLKERDEGMHEWTLAIPDLPLAWNSREIWMRKLGSHFLYVWRGAGCIRPHESTIFATESQEVIIIPAFVKGDPKRELVSIKGEFIELDVNAFKRVVTKRKSKGSLTDAIVFMFNAAYGKTWTW